RERVEGLAQPGWFEESASYAGEAVALAEGDRRPDTLLWAYHAEGVHHLVRGEARGAIGAFERAEAVWRAHDMPTYRPRTSAELGVARAPDRQHLEALPVVQAEVRGDGRQADSHS